MTPAGHDAVRLSPKPVRTLHAADLELEVPDTAVDGPGPVGPHRDGPVEPVHPYPDPPVIPDDDPHLSAVLELLEHYGGVILTGPPGTSKTWYAEQIALKLTGGDRALVRIVQFHPSYQYEDFVQGYVPTDGGGFVLRGKHLMELCTLADNRPNRWVVLVINELSRGDPGRIFGEALTYVERTKRGSRFHLASGTELSIPHNLVILATMNPLDRGVDEVDAAFERRFAKIAMDPDAALLERFLAEAGMEEVLRARVLAFFEVANRRARTNPYSAVGHAFFLGIADEAGLRRLWRHQLRFLFQKAYQLDPEGLGEVERAWERVFAAS